MNFMKKLISIFIVLGILASTIVFFNINNNFKLYVYDILLDVNPKLAYRICLNNLDNKKTKIKTVFFLFKNITYLLKYNIPKFNS